MNNYTDWLKSSTLPRVLAVQVQTEVSGSTITRYLSTSPITIDGIEYLPIIKTNIAISSSISLEYSASVSFGDIELANNTGIYDSWLDHIWSNKPCKVYYGELPASPINQSLSSNYEIIFDGIVEDIDSKSATTLNIKIRDKLEKLNYPVTEAVLGNYFHGQVLADNSPEYSNSSKNTLKPLVFGEVHNITPISTDPTQLEYMVSAGPVEKIIEVLDNGVPISFRPVKASNEIGDIPPGSFRLNTQAFGTVTASVQGIAKTITLSANPTYSDSYKNTAANTIATILRFYGKQLDLTEIDITSFTEKSQEPIGIYLNERKNVLVLCQEIAKNCGCVLVTTRTGRLKLVSLELPNGASTVISDQNIIYNSLRLAQKPQILAGIKLGYAKNWTILNGLVTGIPEAHKTLFAIDYLEAPAKNMLTQTLYGVSTEPELEGTYLIDQTSALGVANKKLTLMSNPRKIVSVQGVQELMGLEVGDPVLISLDRLGIANATPGLVMSTKPDWLRGKTDLEVLV